jgi:hypothetical protein
MSFTLNQRKNIFYFSRPAPFPQLLYVGYVAIIVAIVQAFTGNYTQAGFLLLIGLAILLMRSWSRLNIRKSSLTDIFSIIPYRKVNVKPVLGISLVEESVTRTLNSRGSTSNIHYQQYKIVLQGENRSIVLEEGKSKKKLLRKARAIAASLEVVLKDATKNS